MPSHGVSNNDHDHDHDHDHDSDIPVLLVRWFERRLHDTVGFAVRGSRLYGLEIIDTEELEMGGPRAARVSFLAEAADREGAVRHDGARNAAEFDAVALVTVEWRPMSAAGLTRPGEFTPRQRARVVELVCDGVGVTIVRYENDPEYIVLASAS
jgi:hypothetical protein